MKKLLLISVCLLLVGAAVAQKQPASLAAAKVAASAAPANQPAALPIGTAVKMKLDTPLSTSRNAPGDVFSGRISEPVRWNGQTVIPAGAILQGRVMRVTEPRRIRGLPTIVLRPDMIIMADGRHLPISAVIVDTDQYSYIDVDDEGRIKGRGHDGDDLKETGIGAGAGAGLGALAGGFHGALVGAAIGTGATVVHWLAKHRSTDLPAGSVIIMELSRPMVVGSKAGS